MPHIAQTAKRHNAPSPQRLQLCVYHYFSIRGAFTLQAAFIVLGYPVQMALSICTAVFGAICNPPPPAASLLLCSRHPHQTPHSAGGLPGEGGPQHRHRVQLCTLPVLPVLPGPDLGFGVDIAPPGIGSGWGFMQVRPPGGPSEVASAPQSFPCLRVCHISEHWIGERIGAGTPGLLIRTPDLSPVLPKNIVVAFPRLFLVILNG